MPINPVTFQDSTELLSKYSGLMLGYLQTDRQRSMYYARRAINLARKTGDLITQADAYKTIGQHHWAAENYDSASVCYSTAIQLIEKVGMSDRFTQLDYDNMLSAMYGTVGNLYNIQEIEDSASIYYDKAQEIFEKYNWNESSSILYYNYAQMYRVKGDFKRADELTEKAYDYALKSGDSLMIAQATKEYAMLNFDMHRYLKSRRYLKKAIEYYSQHKVEESENQIELLETKADIEQRLFLRAFLLVSVVVVLSFVLSRLLSGKKTVVEPTPENTVPETPIAEAATDADSETVPEPDNNVELTEREREILELIVQGKTNPQIAEQIFLSTETVKWYRKRLLAKFEANNTATLVRIVLEKRIL